MSFILFFLLLLSCEARREYPEVSKIPWERSWEEALERAGSEKKPVFVYFYAVWCSWCREYEEVLERKRVRSLISERFVPLLLDIDRDRRLFVKFGGRGTPFTVLLSPEGKMLVRFHGVAKEKDLLGLLSLVLEGSVGVLEKKKLLSVGEVSGKRCAEIKSKFIEDLKVRFDPVFGGFSSPSEGGAVFKWPTPFTYAYLLERGYLVEEALFSLDKDIEYLFDRVDGGFFNFYDRSRAFEFFFETSKSLKVNGGMILALVEAFKKTGKDEYLKLALETFSYLERNLLHGSGCYLNAQVSDPKYYNLPPEERKKRRPPHPDTAIVVEDNSRAVLGLLSLYRVTGDRRLAERAKACLRYMLNNLLEGKTLYRFYDVKNGKKGDPNFGMDVSFFSLALLEAGMKKEALRVALLEADHTWVSRSVLLYTLLKLGKKEEALELAEKLSFDPDYHNPDDMVFLIRSLELLIGRC